MDLKYIKTLGPFARVLFETIYNGEVGRDPDDKIMPGENIEGATDIDKELMPRKEIDRQVIPGTDISDLQYEDTQDTEHNKEIEASNNMLGAFMIFRGTKLYKQQIDRYEKNLLKDQQINLPGFASCSRRIQVAIIYATTDIRED